MKTGIKTIIAGVSLVILGVFAVPAAIVLPLILGDSNEKQFEIPGNTQIAVEKPGRYYLWNDYQTVFQGKSYNRFKSIPDGIEIKITNAETGELLDFVSDISISSSIGSSSQNTIGYIELQEPCSVDITVIGGAEKRVFSFSKSKLRDMLWLIIGGFVLSPTLGIAGFGITTWGIVKLGRSNKKGEQGAPANVNKPHR